MASWKDYESVESRVEEEGPSFVQRSLSDLAEMYEGVKQLGPLAQMIWELSKPGGDAETEKARADMIKALYWDMPKEAVKDVAKIADPTEWVEHPVHTLGRGALLYSGARGLTGLLGKAPKGTFTLPLRSSRGAIGRWKPKKKDVDFKVFYKEQTSPKSTTRKFGFKKEDPDLPIYTPFRDRYTGVATAEGQKMIEQIKNAFALTRPGDRPGFIKRVAEKWGISKEELLDILKGERGSFSMKEKALKRRKAIDAKLKALEEGVPLEEVEKMDIGIETMGEKELAEMLKAGKKKLGPDPAGKLSLRHLMEQLDDITDKINDPRTFEGARAEQRAVRLLDKRDSIVQKISDLRGGERPSVVAFRDKGTGKIFVGKKNEVHGEAYLRLIPRGMNMGHLEDGFMTTTGKFVTKPEAKKLWGADESVNLGIIDLEKRLRMEKLLK